MASATVGAIPAALMIDTRSAEMLRVVLDQSRHRLGRSSTNDLSFPDDPRLSREHLVFERSGRGWTVRDLGSRNGTNVNGILIHQPVQLGNGDRIVAGNLTIHFYSDADSARTAQSSVELVDEPSTQSPVSHTVVTDLRAVLSASDPGQSGSTLHAHLRALVHVGRELASHRPLEELFQTVLTLSVDAVKASRGVLMTEDNGKLVVRANCGEGFRISTAVVQRVLEEKKSLLILDASLDLHLAQRNSIVAEKVKGILAVPLQTDERAFGLIYLDCSHKVRDFNSEDLNLLTVMANIAAIKIEHARLLEVEQAEKLLGRELQQAAEIQRTLLPSAAPHVVGFDMAGYNSPCRTVGGDYFDFLKFPDGRIALIVADVAGKGLPAALLMSGLHARVQVIFDNGDNLATGIERLNRSLTASYPGNRFITFFMAVLNPLTGELRFCNAGHNPPLLLRADDSVELLEATGIVLGILPASRYSEKVCQLGPGDLLALFSDGLTEACNPKEDVEFGEERLLAVLREHRHRGAAEIVDVVNEAVASHTARSAAMDDVTVVIARRS